PPIQRPGRARPRRRWWTAGASARPCRRPRARLVPGHGELRADRGGRGSKQMQQRERGSVWRRRAAGWAVRLGVAAASLATVARAEVTVSENANRRFNQGVRYLT